MNDLVDRILNTYQLMRPLDADRVSDSRQKITRYIESLAFCRSERCPAVGGLWAGYLKELHEGQTSFTGC